MNTQQFKPHFMLIPSLACQAECSYCFGPRQGQVMTENTAVAALDFIENIVKQTNQSKISITFHGGEPLLAGYELWKFILEGLSRRFARHRLKLGVQSNLWLLDDRFCRLFKAFGVEINTSLDGPQLLNDRQRGNGYFERTVLGVKLAREYGMKVNCIATFTAESSNNWRDVMNYFISNGIDFSIHGALPPMKAETAVKVIGPDTYGTMLIKMLAYYLKNSNRLRVNSLDQFCQSVAYGQGQICTFRDCLGMFLAIDPQGDIYPCQRFCGHFAFRLGNIQVWPSLEDIFSQPVALQISSRQKKVEEECRDCEHLDYCRGGCLYNAWAGGDWDRVKDPYCDAYQRVFKNIKNRLQKEMSSETNINAIAENPYQGIGHPLLKKGPLIELAKKGPHPAVRARNAQMVVAAVAMAETPQLDTAAGHLLKMGVMNNKDECVSLLNGLQQHLKRRKRLNNLYLYITYRCQLKCQSLLFI